MYCLAFLSGGHVWRATAGDGGSDTGWRERVEGFECQGLEQAWLGDGVEKLLARRGIHSTYRASVFQTFLLHSVRVI